MIGVAGIYTAYMFRSGASRRLRVSRQTFERLRQGAFERGLKWNKSSLWSSNLLVYWIGFAFVVVLVLTGIAIYRVDWGGYALFGGYDTSRWIDRACRRIHLEVIETSALSFSQFFSLCFGSISISYPSSLLGQCHDISHQFVQIE